MQSHRRAPNLHEAAREPDFIEVIGSREHNLHIERLEVPKRKLVVFTGVSGSGKSSLAFDTLYAEGQRRYVETLSSYARQFLGQMQRPDVEHLRGLSPTIAIEQKSASNNPRSTVGTITEIYDYLRLLYARAGEQHCHKCGKPVQAQTPEQIAAEILALPEGARATLVAPLVTHRKGEFRELFDDLRARGFLRVEVDGEAIRLDEVPEGNLKLAKHVKHTIGLVVDRIPVTPDNRQRLVEGVELGLREGKGELQVAIEGGSSKSSKSSKSQKSAGTTLTFSVNRACCGQSFPELSPQNFSFNSPLGMCGACNGLGTRLEVDPELVIPDGSLSIRDGAIAPWASAMARGEGWTFRIAESVAKACKVDLDVPWKRLGAKKQRLVLFGMEGQKIAVAWGKEGSESHGTFGMTWEGVIPGLMRRFRDSTSDTAREQYRRFMREVACDVCEGRRLRPETMAVFLAGKSIADVTGMTVKQAMGHFEALTLSGARQQITEGVQREIASRLGFLLNVGLDYLTLNRGGPTLSGGEAQRIRLASQLGSELSGVMYVLDEPSIGLHQRDNGRLIATLRRLRDLGNTVLVVEHDEETVRAADHVIDFGPGAGHLGGKVIAAGTPEEIEKDPDSLTGAYLSGRIKIETPKERRAPRAWIEILGATEHNLKDIHVKVPLGVLAAVTGVSGAGKSSLVNGILLPALGRELHGALDPVGAHQGIKGLDALDKVIAIDQKPIGRTPRSNPGTYTKAFDQIRELFAQLPDARARGWESGRFSFNVKGGRCESCHGDGVVKVEMHFLADVYVTCELCKGKRYNEQTLSVRYKGKSIADILDTSIDECLKLFEAVPALKRILMTLAEVGLGYMKIGQSAPTMSGGEAQRVKLSRELGKSQTGRTLYVLDEPTTGLHFEDIRKLLGVLQRLVEGGNTVVVIEHNLDVIRCADWLIDIGPEGGDGGGRVIAEGTPEQVARVQASYTGQFLQKMLS
ncbi:excinuclease ABC subunit UvrA [Chondromyces apiculatus]|uniref:UvrABC system protein A n=1 Tax=Chondromyces apiculatus DSM 436 TaxID=1192034 RepID=A0A017SZF2_9BACT|nr:excinuclease ABC subunit UvrA [Chondromyces apiculatus]EYF02353.1 Excinuclease ABC subunit A [Chondromyces apiculatus DSM 436]